MLWYVLKTAWKLKMAYAEFWTPANTTSFSMTWRHYGPVIIDNLNRLNHRLLSFDFSSVLFQIHKVAGGVHKKPNQSH